MKGKFVSLLVSGLVLGAAFTIGGIYLFNRFDGELHFVNITVLWDEPGPEFSSYNISTTEPEVVEVYSLPKEQRLNLFSVFWDFERNISLSKTETGVYHGEMNMSLQSDLIYIVKVPQDINTINFIDDLTAVEINQRRETNDLTIHFWESHLTAKKPVIYLYNTNGVPFRENVSVSIPHGCAIETIPEIPLGPEITWENIEVYPDSQILFDGEYYPYLYYDARIEG
jgi:hypothetical protein